MIKPLDNGQAFSVLNVQDTKWETPLHLVARNNYSATCKHMLSGLTQHHLLEILKIFNNDGKTAMHLAIAKEDGADGEEISNRNIENTEEAINNTIKNLLENVESEENRFALLKKRTAKIKFLF